MQQYFETFPKRLYDLKGDGRQTLVTDIFRRVKVRNNIKDNLALMSTYDVVPGDTPETISYKHFGSTDYFWVICLINNITDRFYDWPLDYQAFEEFVKDKYDNPDAIHHYEKTQTSGAQTGNGPADFSHKIEVNSTDPDAQSVSNYEYEQRLQDQKRQIKLLDKAYLNVFLEEFERLVQR
tara:strand:+ start:122 stop:661 length:540 start_codon:yes stop_codon:yes gene_type:complete